MRPTSVLAWAMTPPRPMHPWAGDLAAVRDGDRASESVLHILLKSLVGGEFRGFGPTRLPVGMPLCDRGSVIQTTAAGCCVPATLPRDHRGVPAQPSGALTGPVFLGRQHGDLLALGKGQVATRRGIQTDRRHPATVTEPPRPQRHRHTARDSHLFTGESLGDPPPKQLLLLASIDRRPSR